MHTFRAMNTEVSVVADQDEAEIARRTARLFEAAERRFSRFRADSELSRLNRAPGPFRASPELFDTLVRARTYAEHTERLFDPAIGSALLALGYDRSFAPFALDRTALGARPAQGSMLDVTLDEEQRMVTRPPHIQLDLGGLVKGATVDRAAALLGHSGAIDAGGDASLRGHPPGEDAWLVEVEAPRDPARSLLTVAVVDGAVATSASNRRRWRAGPAWVHHLIDPRTQRCATEDLLQATVFAPRAELADVLAKVAFVLGPRGAPPFLERHQGVSAVLVPRSGRPILVGRLDVREVHHA